ncbi:MAG: ATP-dependent 6-phosphofructokinase [Candidatus Eisenbacteria bacterium]|nr:ATP-dependent 6-phosphofructokinase [Candidatus Eisenbacteria bacterium]
MKKIAILTGGGDCPGLNAVIRAVVKTAYHDYGVPTVGIKDGFKGLVEGRWKDLKESDVSGILDKGGTILGTTNRDDPFHINRIVNGKEVSVDESDRVVSNLKEIGATCLIVVGGDGSLKIASELCAKGVPVVGVPKTIDNDLEATDITFGFHTAVATATEAIDKLHTTAESHHRIMLLEVMGRYAGWIAIESGLAGGGDVILIPEIPFKIGKIVETIEGRIKRGRGFSIVVVAEGAHAEGEEMTFGRTVKGSPEPKRLGGVSIGLAQKLEEATGYETRATVLGHLQRGGSPTPFDRILATRFGAHAASLAISERYGTMSALKGERIKEVPICDAIGKMKKVDPNGDLVKLGRSLGVSFGT